MIETCDKSYKKDPLDDAPNTGLVMNSKESHEL